MKLFHSWILRLCLAASLFFVAGLLSNPNIASAQQVRLRFGPVRDAVAVGKVYYPVNASPSDAIDDTSAIQAALDEADAAGGGQVKILTPGEYLVGSPSTGPPSKSVTMLSGITIRAALTIGSNTSLELGSGVVLRLAAGANRVMLANKDPVGRNRNILLYGSGTIRNDQAQSIDNTGPEFYGGQTVVLMGVDDLSIRELTFDTSSTSIKYAVQIGDATHVKCKGLTGRQLFSDFLHFNGPLYHLEVSDIHAIAVAGHGDNVVALIASEGGNLDVSQVTLTGYYPELTGDSNTYPREIRWFKIDGVYAQNTFQPVRATGRPTDTIRDGEIKSIHGTSQNGPLVAFSDDYQVGGLLVGCLMDSIDVIGVTGFATPGSGMVQINARNAKNITVRGVKVGNQFSSAVTYDASGSASFPLSFTGASWDNANLRLTKTGAFNRYVWQEGDQIAVTAGTNTTIGQYRVTRRVSDDAIEIDRTIGASASAVAFVQMSLQSLTIDGIDTPNATIGAVINLASSNGGGIGRVNVSNCNIPLGVKGRLINAGGPTDVIPDVQFTNCVTDGLGNHSGEEFGISLGSPGSFIYDEVITQASSGAVGRFRGFESTNNKAFAIATSGTFNGTNVITGSTSGATFTPSSRTSISIVHYLNGAQVLPQTWRFDGVTTKNGGTAVQSSSSALTIFYDDWTGENLGGNLLFQTTTGTLRIQGAGFKKVGSYTTVFTGSGTAKIQINDPDCPVLANRLTPKANDRVYNETATTTLTANGVPVGVGPVIALETQTTSDLYTGAPAGWIWAVDQKTTRIAAKTADWTISYGEHQTNYTNAGASGTVTGTLPAARAGYEYTFTVAAAQSFRIDPNGTETVALPSTGVPGAAGKYLTSNTVGNTVTLIADTTGTWRVKSYTGTWTAEP